MHVFKMEENAQLLILKQKIFKHFLSFVFQQSKTALHNTTLKDWARL